ncbi:MAG: ATP synthase F0 subunit B [Bryobacterales bacterium]|nr:ATP synthase F0 subunit B [Bryobacterales bacterium]
MDETLHALGGILLRALPTFFLVVLLHFYLKYVFFRPLDRVLQARYDATEGARRLAERSLLRASAKAEEYETRLRAVRAEIYKEQEEARRRLEKDQAAAIDQARHSAGAAVAAARAQLDGEVMEAKRALDREAEVLAVRIAEAVLPRRAA